MGIEVSIPEISLNTMDFILLWMPAQGMMYTQSCFIKVKVVHIMKTYGGVEV
jgi:hypothetical protein